MARKTSKKKAGRRSASEQPKADTTAGRVGAVQDAASRARALPIEPPDHVTLREADWPFWSDIVAARAADSWNAADLVKAAHLARCLADIEDVQVELDIGGHTSENARGTPVVNPLHNVLNQLTQRSLQLARALHVHASATQGRANKTGDKTKRDERADGVVDAIDADEDDLLARPPLH